MRFRVQWDGRCGGRVFTAARLSNRRTGDWVLLTDAAPALEEVADFLYIAYACPCAMGVSDVRGPQRPAECATSQKTPGDKIRETRTRRKCAKRRALCITENL